MRTFLCSLLVCCLSAFYAGLYSAVWVTSGITGRLIFGAFTGLMWGVSVAAVYAMVRRTT